MSDENSNSGGREDWRGRLRALVVSWRAKASVVSPRDEAPSAAFKLCADELESHLTSAPPQEQRQDEGLHGSTAGAPSEAGKPIDPPGHIDAFLIHQAQPIVCSMLCPSTRKGDEPWPHHGLCEAMKERLRGA